MTDEKVGYRPPGGGVVVLGDWHKVKHCYQNNSWPNPKYSQTIINNDNI